MAKYISIATTITGTPTLQFGTDLITYVHYASATSLVIYSGSKAYTLTVAGATTTNVYNAINAAILNPSGPTLNAVALPNGATVTGIAIA
jgi:hypothetical protein